MRKTKISRNIVVFLLIITTMLSFSSVFAAKKVDMIHATETYADPEYSIKAETAKDSQTVNVSKVTWNDNLSPMITLIGTPNTTPLKDVKFTFEDPAATDESDQSGVNNSTIMYTLINSSGIKIDSGKDLGVLTGNQRPGKYYIEVDVLDNATNPGVDATTGTVERYGPFPETGGITPPTPPGGALKVRFAGGESILSKLNPAGILTANFDRNLRGQAVTVTLVPLTGGSATVDSATNVTATGASRIKFAGAALGESYTMKITVDGKSFQTKITFA